MEHLRRGFLIERLLHITTYVRFAEIQNKQYYVSLCSEKRFLLWFSFHEIIIIIIISYTH